MDRLLQRAAMGREFDDCGQRRQSQPVMRQSCLEGRIRLWLAALVGVWIVGCGPLGGCGSGNVAAGESARPEQGHPMLVEGPSDPAPEDDAKVSPAPVMASESPPAVEAVRAHDAALSVLGEDMSLGTYYEKSSEVSPSPSGLDALPGSEGGSGRGKSAQVLDGTTLGRFVPLEGAEYLGDFYSALRRLRAGKKDDGKVRILLYGASHTAADIYPTYLRAYLGERFGDGGPGYVSLVQTNRWYRLLAWTVTSSKHWLVEHAQRKGSREDGFFGLLGASTTSKRKSAKSRLKPRISGPEGDHKTTYEVYFLAQPGGGGLSLIIDGEPQDLVSTKAGTSGPGYASYTVAGGPHEVEISPDGSGEVRLFGMTVEYDRPGIVVDTLGINGTRASNNLRWDQPTWADNIRRRAPDLYVLAYGTNEATDAGQPIAAYKRSLGKVLDRYRAAAPEASCVLLGPGDFPKKLSNSSYGPRERLTEVVAAQSEVAAAKGCAFWDALAFMGGEGSMDLWAKATPQMGRGDHIHLTRRGYVRLGMAFTDALMQGFDRSAATQHAAK